MNKKILKEIRQGIKMIKKILTLRIKFNEILSKEKYKKETKVSKGDTCILGISKL